MTIRLLPKDIDIQVSHYFAEGFFSPSDQAITEVSRKIFKFLDRPSFYKICIVNKHLYKVLTNVHYKVTPELKCLFKKQCIRLNHVRNNRQLKDPYYELLILKGAYHESRISQEDNINIIYSARTRSKDKLKTFPELVLIAENGTETPIEVSENCKKSIHTILEKKHPEKYNCVDFAMESVGLYEETKLNHPQGRWTKKTFHEKDLVSGDIITLYKNNVRQHYGIYLADGIYISKFGVLNLRLTSLEDMKKAYEADMAYKISPKQP